MKREEALEHFVENYVKVKSVEKQKKLDDYYEKNKDELSLKFIESFKQLCQKIKEIQAIGQKGKISYIVCSMLRTNIICGVNKYVLEAFNDLLYLDKNECQIEYDAGWAFGFLDEFEEELLQNSKFYINKITKADIERLKLKETVLYNERIERLVRYAMPKAAMTQEFKDIQKEDILEVSVGEYRSLRKLVYKESIRSKHSKEIKYWLEEKYEFEYTYEVLKELDLSDGDYEGIDISYGDFGKSNISRSNMKNTNLKGTKFCESLLEEVNFAGVAAAEAVFDSANLKGASFKVAKAEGASFKGANLEGVCFEGADLSYCDMTGANLVNVNFKGAILKGTIFNINDTSGLMLDEEQKKDIVFI